LRILVVNAGSSSLKLRVLDDEDQLAGSADLPAPTENGHQAIADAVGGFGRIDAVGHRIVHGGMKFSAPVRIDDEVVRRLTALVDYAPLHQPKSLAALRAVMAVLPDVPSVACFDTAFHAGLPAAAATYALPREWRVRWDLRRYGFHGLSHDYASARVAELIGRPREELRIVTAHLGAGASLAAVTGGRSVDTTMGFTPLEGLVMATRSGSVDPGLVLWLEEHAGMPPAELASTLEQRAGLLGLAGTADMKEVIDRAAAGEADARLALDVYVHRLRAGIASMAAAMGGLDALVFTGGVGERAPDVRQRACEGLGFLGLAVDEADGASSGGKAAAGYREISAKSAAARTFVVEAREDLQIAREVRRVLSGSGRES
jgi:acetate kinase